MPVHLQNIVVVVSLSVWYATLIVGDGMVWWAMFHMPLLKEYFLTSHGYGHGMVRGIGLNP